MRDFSPELGIHKHVATLQILVDVWRRCVSVEIIKPCSHDLDLSGNVGFGFFDGDLLLLISVVVSDLSAVDGTADLGGGAEIICRRLQLLEAEHFKRLSDSRYAFK
ncbi:hypothetical protein V2J09_016622 [Rumex salicifolius]